jgi:hypothetical protein
MPQVRDAKTGRYTSGGSSSVGGAASTNPRIQKAKAVGGGAPAGGKPSKMTQAAVSKLNRKQLESKAIEAARKNASKQGISADEAERRARMLMSSNSDAQLRKFVYKNQ